MQLFLIKAKLAIKSIGRVLLKPAYLVLAILFSFLFMQLLYWSTNFDFLGYILSTSNLNFVDKISVIWSAFLEIIKDYHSLRGLLLIVISLLQGIVLSLLVFTIKGNKQFNSNATGTSIFATALATLGLGCVSCGTSLLTPLISVFVSGSATALAEKITTPLLILSLLLIFFALYKTGLQAANILANKKSIDTA